MIMRKFILSTTLAVMSMSVVPQIAIAKDVVPVVKGLTRSSSSFADLAEKLTPSVVNVSSTQKVAEQAPMQGMPDMPQFPPGSPFEDFFEEFMGRRGGDGGGMAPSLPPTSLGSGFIIDGENGYIITNNHVVRDAEEVRVTFHDDTTMKAKIVGLDEKTDIAVLKVETEKELTGVSFGDSAVMRVGDWVLAIGNPFGLGGTVTSGIVSARQRDINSGPYDDFIQTDASINRGNSGGPMFNLEGEVIGINTAIFSPTGGSVGIGFAIPSNLANPIINQLIEYGRTRRGWLGVRIQTVTDEIAESLELGKARGALVASVTPGGPAEKAELKAGDIITKFDGKKVSAMRTLPRIVAETPIEKEVTLEYWRDGKINKAKVAIGELEKAEEDGLLAKADEPSSVIQTPDKGTKVEEFGMTLGALSKATRQKFNVGEDVQGVIVLESDVRGMAAEKGIMSGDVIVEINQTAMASPADVANTIEAAKKAKRSSVLLLINRDDDVRFVALKLDQKK